jgi:hypothetical protein
MALIEPIKVNVEASTSSPSPTPKTLRARCMAAVPLVTAKAFCELYNATKSQDKYF